MSHRPASGAAGARAGSRLELSRSGGGPARDVSCTARSARARRCMRRASPQRFADPIGAPTQGPWRRCGRPRRPARTARAWPPSGGRCPEPSVRRRTRCGWRLPGRDQVSYPPIGPGAAEDDLSPCTGASLPGKGAAGARLCPSWSAAPGRRSPGRAPCSARCPRWSRRRPGEGRRRSGSPRRGCA